MALREIETLVESFSGKYQSKLAKITKPLKDHFGIEYFCYQKITNSGEWHLLGNNADWLHFSADNNLYQHDPSLVHPGHCRNGFFFPDLCEVPEIHHSFVDQARMKFNLQNTLVIINKSKTYVEYFIFATSTDNNRAYHHYVNNLDLLSRTYADFFKNEAKGILTRLEDNNIDLQTLPNSPFLLNQPTVLMSPERNDGKCFLSEISNNKITTREIECIALYAQGLTAKKSAQQLHVSHRTVEGHLNNAKNKLGLEYKHQLLNHPLVQSMINFSR